MPVYLEPVKSFNELKNYATKRSKMQFEASNDNISTTLAQSFGGCFSLYDKCFNATCSLDGLYFWFRKCFIFGLDVRWKYNDIKNQHLASLKKFLFIGKHNPTRDEKELAVLRWSVLQLLRDGAREIENDILSTCASTMLEKQLETNTLFLAVNVVEGVRKFELAIPLTSELLSSVEGDIKKFSADTKS